MNRPPSSGQSHNKTQGYQRYHSRLAPPKKRKELRLSLLLLSGAAVLAVVVGLRLWDYHQSRLEYENLAAQIAPEAASAPAEAPAPPFSPLPSPSTAPAEKALASTKNNTAPKASTKPFYSGSVNALKRQNPDAVAWLDIPDTAMQYPVVQGKDNQYYETHSFAKKSRAGGAIFADAWNLSDFSDFNTVIYGHHMKDGSMFTELREYRHDNFLRNHKYIVLTLENSQKQYKVFAAYDCDEKTDFRGFTHNDSGLKKDFLLQIEKRSEIFTNAEVTVRDKLLTLVTCTGGDRDRYWVVHAVLVEDTTEVPA